MPPAATLNSPTSHGKPLSPGPPSLNVLIGGQPAWRATSDFHQCPLFDGPKPHVGGVVSKGSITVLINSLQAARQGDMVMEAGPPNPISQGVLTVLIGG